MNNKNVNELTAAQGSVMDCIPSVEAIGHNILLSEQAHNIRTRVDELDDQRRAHYRKRIREMALEDDREKRLKIDVELQEMERVEDKYESMDDQLHSKIDSYIKAISGLYTKAISLLKRACSVFDPIIDLVTALFSSDDKKEAV